MRTYKVGYLIGSLAKASINRKLATALVRLAPTELETTFVTPPVTAEPPDGFGP